MERWLWKRFPNVTMMKKKHWFYCHKFLSSTRFSASPELCDMQPPVFMGFTCTRMAVTMQAWNSYKQTGEEKFYNEYTESKKTWRCTERAFLKIITEMNHLGVLERDIYDFMLLQGALPNEQLIFIEVNPVDHSFYFPFVGVKNLFCFIEKYCFLIP